MPVAICDEVPVTGSLERDVIITILLPPVLLLIAHLLLLLHTLYQEFKQRNNEIFIKCHCIRLLYIFMQILALLFLINELLRFAIDIHNNILGTSFQSLFCTVCAHFGYYIPGFFYGLYLFAINIRLEKSMKGSSLALSRRTSQCLKVLVLMIPISATFALALDSHNDAVCLQHWGTADSLSVDTDGFRTYCTLPAHSLRVFKYHIYDGIVALINVLNISFGVLLTIKLRELIKMGNGQVGVNEQKKCQFKALIVRNIILTLTGGPISETPAICQRLSDLLNIRAFDISLIFSTLRVFLMSIVQVHCQRLSAFYYLR